jgi:hypothetical protein
MKPFTITCGFALLLLIASSTNSAAQDSKSKTKSSASKEAKKSPAPKPDEATAMANWTNYMTPGDMHKMMATWDGVWNAEITMWMDEKTAPQNATGKAEYKMILNGLYQSSKYTGDMMGMPFEGMSTTGFDNHKKVFLSTWIDNMGSGIMIMEGPWDAASKTMTLKGKMVDPASGEEKDFKQVIKIIDDNTQLMEMYGPGENGKEFKTMQIKYTRAK